MRTRFSHTDFPLERLVRLKGGHHVSVVLPARNEAPTVGAIVRCLLEELGDSVIDEVVVVDDHSEDETAAEAERAGAMVVAAATVRPDLAIGPGKGQALWKGLLCTTGDLVVYCDADLRDFRSEFVSALVGPMLVDPEIHFVKAVFDRPYNGAPGEGGRVTELVARPLLSLVYPELAHIAQPLVGEYAGRRAVLERVPFVEGYGVDLGLLIDVAAEVGATAVAQVELGERVHRNRPISQLVPQATVVMQTALTRAGLLHADVHQLPPLAEVTREP
jgi:glucosyl-3-phosphoglycerate synthase